VTEINATTLWMN